MISEMPPQFDWDQIEKQPMSEAGSIAPKSHVSFHDDLYQSEVGTPRKRRRGPGSGPSSVGSKSRVSLEEALVEEASKLTHRARSHRSSVKSKSECSHGDFKELADTEEMQVSYWLISNILSSVRSYEGKTQLLKSQVKA